MPKSCQINPDYWLREFPTFTNISFTNPSLAGTPLRPDCVSPSLQAMALKSFWCSDKQRGQDGATDEGIEVRQTWQSRVHMISAAAADWQAAGSGGTDSDPKDVARMVGLRHREKGGRLTTADPHIHYLTPPSSQLNSRLEEQFCHLQCKTWTLIMPRGFYAESQ